MQFLYPNVLFLLSFLAVLIFLINTNKDNLQRFFSKDILNKLQVNKKTMRHTTRNILLFISLILFVISLARPVMNEQDQKVKQKLIPIVIALDVSKSMMATDIYPSRLALAKKKLKQIINTAKNTTIGIVLFAQNSYVVSPITEDFTSLNYIIDNLDTSLNFANGSNIMAVLEATNQMLEDYKVKNLIILSDGGNDDTYSDELEFANESEISIYSVGLATKNGAPIPDENGYITDANGNIVTVPLNESIKKLSINSGGGYIGFSLASEDINAILNQIQSQSKKEELDTKKIKTYTELFYYPLALGLFCLLIAFSSLPTFRKNILSLFLLGSIFYPQIQQANMLDFKTLENAKQNYENKKYKEAIDNYKNVKASNEQHYNLANSYYKNKEFKKAIDSYSKIVTKDKNLEFKKLHNLGNSYVNEKKLEKAKEFYKKALKIKEDKETKENLEAVNKALEKKKKQDKKNKKNNKKDDKKQKDNKKKSDDEKKKDKEKEKNKKDKKSKKEKEDKESKKKKTKQQKMKKQPISDMEEKKWLKALQKKKVPIMLQKVDSKKYNNQNIQQPW